MAGSELELAVAIDPGPDCDADDWARLDQGLRAELADLDVEAIRSVSNGPPPDDARAADALTVGGFVVVLGSSRLLLRAVVDVTVAWLGRQPQPRVVELTLPGGGTLKVTGVSSAQQSELVTHWVECHAPPE